MINGDMKRTICFAEFELDTAHRRLMRGGEQVVLNPKAFDLLVFLAENRGRVVTKDEILDGVWDGQFVEEANLTVQMSTLRKALGEKKKLPAVPRHGARQRLRIHRRHRHPKRQQRHRHRKAQISHASLSKRSVKNWKVGTHTAMAQNGNLVAFSFYSLPLAFLLFLGVGGFFCNQ
jgi:DNA-binding winged helix-turn-helix (wHTH) protein